MEVSHLFLVPLKYPPIKVIYRWYSTYNFKFLLKSYSYLHSKYQLKNILTQLVLNYKPYELQFYLSSDNKGGTELNIYSDLVNCRKFVKDLNGLKEVFKVINEEAERRYKLLFDAKLENVKSYNKKFRNNKLPNILFVIEEFAGVYKDKSIFYLNLF